MWMQDGCEVYMDSYMAWIMFHGHLDYFQKPPLGGRRNTKPGDHDTLNVHNRWFIQFYHVWGGPACIDIHQKSIWLRARSHMTSHYTWGSVTTLHDFRGVLGRPWDTFFWTLTISWSRLLALVWSGLKLHPHDFNSSKVDIFPGDCVFGNRYCTDSLSTCDSWIFPQIFNSKLSRQNI